MAMGNFVMFGTSRDQIEAKTSDGRVWIEAVNPSATVAGAMHLSDQQVDQIAEVLNGVIAARDPAIIEGVLTAEQAVAGTVRVPVGQRRQEKG